MNILVGSHYFETHKGGIEIVAGELARALVACKGMSVAWMASDAACPPNDFPGTLVALPCWNGTESRLGVPLPVPSARAVSEIRSAVERCDLLLLHDALYPTNVVAANHARRRSKPVLMVQHIGLVPYRNRLLRSLMQIVNATLAARELARADQVVFISGLTQKYFAERVRFRRPPRLVFNGLRSDLPLPDTLPARCAARSILGLHPDRFTVLFAGRFVEKKGLGVVRRLAGAMPDAQWTFCGWGPVDPASWNMPNVHVLGALGAAGIAAAYRAADVLVLPSVGEGLPLVVQEALAFGMAVVGSEDLLVAEPWLRDRIVAVPLRAED
ncbi:MAG TPA: glycosyltransferase family 4 protein, partial [Steroidobacteraceae bacterium]|nr:glycosyltransferase family 4 protein [Steroidobacteraceae bacterium]